MSFVAFVCLTLNVEMERFANLSRGSSVSTNYGQII